MFSKIEVDAGSLPALTAAFLARLSIEITPKQIEKVGLLRDRLPQGTCVYVALIDPADLGLQVEAVSAIRAAGLEPVPHVPARFVRDRADLEHRLSAFATAGRIAQALVLGGGASQPLGTYDAAIQLLETGLFEAHDIRRIGIAGHPEGNPDIIKAKGEAALTEALKVKQAYLLGHGIEGYIATQFLFEAGAVA
jgi:methylenetetrahydrofolate reductase (NADPH)